ncbi:helix-turn-helix domain-containing protein [Streptomyces sp. 6N223]|uniref:helix-turn-helix domain-containing protein n=1 Tax=Streptomyces sp. 6N223 TaxID=3457412 RepID=UPI003FD16412
MGAPGEHLNDLEHFGIEVREARKGRKITQKQLGRSAGKYSESYVSKVEAGALLCSEKLASGCDLVFASNGLFERLRERIVKRGHPSWFRPYAKLEEEAVSILDYSASLIMGLLQTREYAEAVFRAQNPRWTSEAIEAKAPSRLKRRDVLAREKPRLLWVVLHESCLRTQVGSARVMEDQLKHVLKEAQSPGVTIQVLPFGTTPPAVDSFTLLTFADRSTMVYADTIMQGQMTDELGSVTHVDEIHDRLRAEALPRAESLALIGTYMEGFTR